MIRLPRTASPTVLTCTPSPQTATSLEMQLANWGYRMVVCSDADGNVLSNAARLQAGHSAVRLLDKEGGWGDE